jgi:tripartite ATP-independent transporter DctM subunit
MNILAGIGPEALTVILFGTCIFLIFSGTPIGFALLGTTCLIGFMTIGPRILGIIQLSAFTQITSYTMLAVPLFIFMGNIIEASGITDGMFNALAPWIGHVKGGLLVVVIIIGTVLAACIGVIAASVILLTTIAMPAMLKKDYNKSFVCGTICVSGSLGILIPPSIMLVIYGPTAGISVGKLFMSATSVGLVLSMAYILYVLIVSNLFPKLAPASEKSTLPIGEKLRMLIFSFVPPILLILVVMGSLMFGIAAPTEASAVGCLGAIILAVAYKKLNLKSLTTALIGTVKSYAMVLMIAVGAKCFTSLFLRLGCNMVVRDLILAAPGGRWGSFLIIMFILFILGMLIDWLGIIMIMVPIITPLAVILGFDPIWFAMMCIVNLQLSFITPPMASAIFFMRGAVRPEWGVQTSTIIRGIFPFIFIILGVLVLCVVFPGILTYLPSITKG